MVVFVTILIWMRHIFLWFLPRPGNCETLKDFLRRFTLYASTPRSLIGALPRWSLQSKQLKKKIEITQGSVNLHRHKQSPPEESLCCWWGTERLAAGGPAEDCGQQLLTIYSIVAKQMLLMPTLHHPQPTSRLIALLLLSKLFFIYIYDFFISPSVAGAVIHTAVTEKDLGSLSHSQI